MSDIMKMFQQTLMGEQGKETLESAPKEKKVSVDSSKAKYKRLKNLFQQNRKK